MDLRPDSAGPHPLEKVADNADIDIGLEQRQSNLPERSIDVGFRKAPLPRSRLKMPSNRSEIASNMVGGRGYLPFDNVELRPARSRRRAA